METCSCEKDRVDTFCRQVKARSEENRRALNLLNPVQVYTVIGSILRQELDSLIRVIYLLTTQDVRERLRLIKDSVEGKEWRDQKGKRITDREMVKISNKLNGWTKSVYQFGCAFIHLSSFHDYAERDPAVYLEKEEKEALVQHIRYYHGGPIGDNPNFGEFILFLVPAFEKVRSNLSYYIEELENNYDKSMILDDL